MWKNLKHFPYINKETKFISLVLFKILLKA